MANKLTTTEAANFLGVSRSWLRRLLRDGKLKGERMGRDWMIDPVDLELLKQKKTGRPRGGPIMD